MNEINLNNYEAYMLDFFEGKLSNEQIIALKAFAVLHPELDLNFEDELVELEKETIHFSDKQKLKANFNDELVIGYLENTLTAEEKKEADTLLRTNTVFINELNLYKKTIAQPDEQVVFENKAQLKREPKVIFFSQTITVRIAAAILLIFGLWYTVNKVLNTKPFTTPELSKKEIIKPSAAPVINKAYNPVITNEQKQLADNPVKKNTKSGKRKVSLNSTESTTLTATPTNTDAEVAQFIKEKTQEKVSYIDTNALKLVNENVKEKTQQKFIIEEENDEEALAVNQAPKKGRLWNLTSKALKALNKNGVEKVNSSSNSNDLFIGALTISKNN